VRHRVRIPFSEGIALLRGAGQTIGDLEDIKCARPLSVWCCG
jgi:hypothetical protein